MKWFWLSLFAFLSVMILALGYWRPDLMEAAVTFVGWYLAVMLALALLALIAAAALLTWQLWQKSRLISLRQRDGAYPLQRIRLRNGGILYYDPNHAVSAATLVHPEHGITEIQPAAGWSVQMAVRLAVERTRQLQAVYPGDDARTHRYGAMSDSPKFPGWRALNDTQSQKRTPAMIDVTPTVETATNRPYTLSEAMSQTASTRLVMGQTADAEIVRWDLAASPHLRVHGKTQGAGKTNLIRCIAASALRAGHHVVVCDRRRFKDWSEFRLVAELIDVREPQRFVAVATRLSEIYQERDALLGQHGAANISRLPAPPQRIVVVIAEFGALCAQASVDGVLDAMLHPLTMVLREAGATGVHVIIEDQVVDQRWPRGISTNTEPVTGYLPQNYGAAGGYYDAHKLPAYTFHHAGVVFRAMDVRTGLHDVLRDAPSVRPLFTPYAGAGEGHSGEQPMNGAMNGTTNDATNGAVNVIPTTTGEWYDWVLAEYLPAHPELLQVDEHGRGVGVSMLARAMAQHARGSPREYEAYKGVASEVAKRLRSDLRLPGGERLGADISRTAAP